MFQARKFYAWCLALVVAALAAPSSLMAQVVMPDASTIVDTAETTFVSVGGLIVSIVGFFIIVKVVKWIRK
jgi:hypothetical protein